MAHTGDITLYVISCQRPEMTFCSLDSSKSLPPVSMSDWLREMTAATDSLSKALAAQVNYVRHLTAQDPERSHP
jgi:hypothetical protein